MATATPSPLPVGEPVDQAHEGSGIIPGDRPEFPLSTSDDAQRLTASEDTDRPRTPPELSFEDSRALLTRLTGLQPWQLEAFPDELPPLPLSRPGSPTRSPDVSRPTTATSQRRLSSTAVPIRFRKPVVPSTTDPSLATSPVSIASPTRSRHGKTHSTEFRNSREFRPLYLVERNRKTDEIDEVLPALPPSSASSVVSGADSEEEFESALESPYESVGQSSNDPSYDPLSAVSDLISPRYGTEPQQPEVAHREAEEIEESGQATPKASDYFTGAQETSSASSGPNYESLTAALEHARAQEQDESTDDAFMSTLTSPQPETLLDTSAPLDDRMMRDVPTPRDAASAPSSSSTRLQDAALGAVVGGLTAAAMRTRSPSPTRSDRDDFKDKVSSVAKSKQPEFETAENVVEPLPKEKGKGKAKKGKKSKKAVAAESPIPAPTEEVVEPSPSFSFAPTFVEDEDDWIKNRSESIVTDDATLVGEPVATPADAKDFRQKVLDSTAPRKDESTEVRRATFDNVPQEAARSIEKVEKAETGLGISTDFAPATSISSRDAPAEPSSSMPADVSTAEPIIESIIEPVTEPVTEPVVEPPTESATEPIIDEEVTPAPKAKKGKKSKKGKRGSKQVEPEPSSLPEIAPQDDQILPSSESQQETIKRDILEPSFERTETNDKVDVMDSLVQGDVPAASADEAMSKEIVPTPVASTNPKEPEMEVPAGPATPELQARPSTSDGPEQAKNKVNVEEQRRASTIEGQSGGSGWGSGLWGALGWGKKKAPSPTSSPPSSPKPQSAVLAALAAAREEAKRKGLPSPPIVPDKKIATVGIRPTLSRKSTQDEPAKPQLQLETEVKRAAVPDQRPAEATRELVQDEAGSTVTPHTAFFTDDGKPSFAFPKMPATPQKQTFDTPKDIPAVEEKTTSQPEEATPSIAFFTDDGKPSFTFSPVPSTPAATSTATESEELPAAKEAKSPAYVSPRSTFFTDDGKPSFTFPTMSSSPAIEPSSTAKEIPITEETTASVGVSPRSTFFTDDGKPSFSYPSIPSATAEQATSIAKETQVPREQTPSTFVAPRSTFFTDDGRPSFAFPSISIPAEQAASNSTDTKIETEQESSAFAVPRSSFFTDDGKPPFAFGTVSTPTASSVSVNKSTAIEEKTAEPLSLARNALFADDGQPTSTISDSVPTESGGSIYDRISLEPSSSKKKIIKPKKKTKKSSVQVPDLDEPVNTVDTTTDASVGIASEVSDEQPATGPVERQLEAERGEQVALEATLLSEEPSAVVSAESAVEVNEPVAAELSIPAVDEVTPSAGKKKAKKSKKSKTAEPAITEAETSATTLPVVPSAERSLDASWNPALRSEKEPSRQVSATSTSESVTTAEDIAINEPSTTETVQERTAPSESEGLKLAPEVTSTTEEVALEESSLPLDLETVTKQEAPTEFVSSVQDDALNTKMSEKSGIPAQEPSPTTVSESVEASEKLSDQPTATQDIHQSTTVEAANIPLPDEQSDKDLTHPSEKDTSVDVTDETKPKLEYSSAPIEAELPTTPKTKKSKKSKRKSGIATPLPEIEVAPEQVTAPLQTSTPASEPVAVTEELFDQTRDVERPPLIEQIDAVEVSLPQQKLDDVADPATVPLPTAAFDEDLSTPSEQPTITAEALTPIESKTEDTPSTPTSKRDKKKKGKKTKDIKPSVEEVFTQEESANVEPSVEQENTNREIDQEEATIAVQAPVELKDEIQDVDAKDLNTKDLDAEKVGPVVLEEQPQLDVVVDQAPKEGPTEHTNDIPQKIQPTHLEPDNSSVAKPSQVADLVFDDVADVPSSKKDKKKKKGKKAKISIEEPSTPVLEEQPELEDVQARPVVAASQPAVEQSVQQAAKSEPIVDDVIPVQEEFNSETLQPSTESAIPVIAEQSESLQPVTVTDEEAKTSLKDSKKDQANEDVSSVPPIGAQRELEPQTEVAGSQDLPEAIHEPQQETSSIRGALDNVLPEPMVGSESTPGVTERQSTFDDSMISQVAPVEEHLQSATLLEEEPTTPSKKSKKKKAKKSKPVEIEPTPIDVVDVKAETEPSIEAAGSGPIADHIPATSPKPLEQPQVESQVTRSDRALDVSPELPVESVTEVSQPSLPAEDPPREPSQETLAIEPETVPLPETPAREIDEPIADDQLATPSKKSKKKKAKKGKPTEIEPSTPVTEVATSQPDPFTNSAQPEQPTAESVPLAQAEPAKSEQAASLAELVALPDTDDNDLEEPVVPQVEVPEDVPAVHETVAGISDNATGTQQEIAQDLIVPASPTQPAVEAEPISKKSKKKAKKGKSIDTSEPSALADEEPAPQSDIPSEPSQDAKRIEDDVPQPPQESSREIPSNSSKEVQANEGATQDVELQQDSATLRNESITDDAATAVKPDVTSGPVTQDPTEQHHTKDISALKPELGDVSSDKTTDFVADVATPVTPLESSLTGEQPVLDTPAGPSAEMDRALVADQFTQPVSSAVPFDDVAPPSKAVADAPRAEETVQDEDAPSTPKKNKKKKKAKKGASASEPETLVAESAPITSETTIAATEEPTTQSVVRELSATELLPEHIEAPTAEQDVITSTTPTQFQEDAQPIVIGKMRDEPVPEQGVEAASLSNEDKTGQEAKKAGVESEAPKKSSTPAEARMRAFDEPNIEEPVASNAQEKPTQESVVETQTVPETASPTLTPVDSNIQDDVPPTTSPAEHVIASIPDDPTPVPRDQDDAMVTQSDAVASTAEQKQAEETTSKKSKKKAKKDKRASVAEDPILHPESSASLPGTTAEAPSTFAEVAESARATTSSKEPNLDITPTSNVFAKRDTVSDATAPPVSEATIVEKDEALTSDELSQQMPTIDALVPEEPNIVVATEEAAAPLSKKDKKKAKKAKRVSTTQEPTSIPPTSIEEKAEPVLEQQIESTTPATEGLISETPVIEETPITLLDVAEERTTIPAPVQEHVATLSPISEVPIQVEAAPEAAGPVSTKDEKKAKKPERESIVDATSVETPVEKSQERSLDTVAASVEQQPSEVPSAELAATSAIVEESSKDETSSGVPAEHKRFSSTSVVEGKSSDAVVTELPSTIVPTEGPAQEPTTPSITNEPVKLSKKEKKKAKKNKQGSIAEAEPFVPSTPMNEPVKGLAEKVNDGAVIDQDPIAPAVEQTEASVAAPASSEEVAASVPVTEQIPSKTTQEETVSSSKKETEKAAEQTSTAEATSSKPLVSTEAPTQTANPSLDEQPSAELPEETIDTATTEALQTEVIDSAAPAAVAEKGTGSEGLITSDDGNVLTEGTQSIIPPAAETTILDVPTMSSTGALPKDAKQDDEQEPEDWAGLSKSQRKKLKKAKRASAVGSEQSESATPAEDFLKDPTFESQLADSQAAQEPTDEHKPTDASRQSTVPGVASTNEMKQVEEQLEPPTATSEPTTDPTPAEQQATIVSTPEQRPGDPKPPDKEPDPLSPPSKKDKKKAKKQAKKAVPFLADETPEAANSDTQPSLSIPTLSETQLPFSGIPTSHPQPFTNNELVDNNDVKIEDIREDGGHEEGKKEEDFGYEVAKRVVEDVQDQGVGERQEEHMEDVRAEAGKEKLAVVEGEVPETMTTEPSATGLEPMAVEQQVAPIPSQEPAAAEVDAAALEIEKPTLAVEEPAPEPNILDKSTVVESSPAVDVEPTSTPEVSIQLELPQHHVSALPDSVTDQPTVLHPREETDNIVEEANSTSTAQPSRLLDEANEVAAPSKKKKKNKKAKHVSTAEEPEQQTGLLKPEQDITDNLSESIAAPEPKEPVASSIEDVQPLEDSVLVEDKAVVNTPEPEADAKPTEEETTFDDGQAVTDIHESGLSPIAAEERQDVLTQPDTSTPVPGFDNELTSAEPILKDTERVVGGIKQPVTAPSEAEQTQKPQFDEPISPKKSKKKSKKAKQTSSMNAPTETTAELQPSQPEGPPSVQLESTQTASEPVTELEVSREMPVSDQHKDTQPSATSISNTPADVMVTVPEEPTSTPLEEVLQLPLADIKREAPTETQEVVSDPSAVSQPALQTSDDIQLRTEELPVPSLSKKDKKKIKKAKKDTDTTTPAEDVVSGLPHDPITEAVPAQQSQGVAELVPESTPVEDVLVSKPDDVASASESRAVEPTTSVDSRVPVTQDPQELSNPTESQPELDVAAEPVQVASQVPSLEDRTIDPPAETADDMPVAVSDLEIPPHAQMQQLSTPTAGQESSLSLADAAPLSKKDKKKAKKAKAKALGRDTPVNEDMVEPKAEAAQDVSARSNEPVIQDALTDAPHDEAVAKKSALPVNQESSLDDSALQLLPTQVDKEEITKSGSTTPSTENVPSVPPAVTLESIVEQSSKDEQVPTTQDAPVAREILIDEPTEEAVSYDASVPTAVPALIEEQPKNVPAVAVESQAEEPALPTISKKKKSKKSKKTDAMTPTTEALPAAESDSIITATDSVVPLTTEARVSFAPVVDEQPKVEEAATQAEDLPLQETTVSTPATETALAASERDSVPQTAILEEAKSETDMRESVPERKLSKKERKKAQKQAAALADEFKVDSEPAVEPSIEPSTDYASAEPSPLADVLDANLVEPTQDSALIARDPVVGREGSREVPEPVREDSTVRTIESLPEVVEVENVVPVTPKKGKKAKKDMKSAAQPVVVDVANEPVSESFELPGQTKASEALEIEPITTGAPQSTDPKDLEETVQDTEQSVMIPIEEPSKVAAKAEGEPFPAVSDTPESAEQPRTPTASQDMDIAVLPNSVPSSFSEVQDSSVPQVQASAPSNAKESEQKPLQEPSSDFLTVAPAIVDLQYQTEEVEPLPKPSTFQPVNEAAHRSQATREVTNDRSDIVKDLAEASAEPVAILDETRDVPKVSYENTDAQPSIVEPSNLEAPIPSPSIITEEVSFETPSSNAYDKEVSPVIPTDALIYHNDSLPTNTEVTKDIERPTTPIVGNAPTVTEADADQVSHVFDAAPEDTQRSLDEQQPIEPTDSFTAHHGAGPVTQDDDVPPNELSPSLKAIQDDAAELRLRAEALDADPATQGDADKSSATEPTSILDLVRRLTKKDKEEAKKSKGDSGTLSTTPATQTEVAVETKEGSRMPAPVSAPTLVEEQVLEETGAVGTPIPVEEGLVPTDVPSRNLSKKEKKKEKAKGPAISFDELHDTPTQSSVPIGDIPKPAIKQPRENLQVATEPSASTTISDDTPQPIPPVDVERVGPIEPATVETLAPSAVTEDVQETIAEDEPVLSRNLDKKDKKKFEQAIEFQDTPVTLSQDISSATVAESQEVALPDYGVAAPSLAPVVEKSPIMSVETLSELAVEELVAAPQTSSQDEETRIDTSIVVPTETTKDTLPLVGPEQQKMTIDESPVPSQELSKKDKKRVKQDALAAQDLEASATRDVSLLKASEPVAISRLHAEPDVKITEVLPEPILTDYTDSTHVSESTLEREQELATVPALARKETKKDKEKSKEDVGKADEVRDEEPLVNPLELMGTQLPVPIDAPVGLIEDAPVAPVTESQRDLPSEVEPQEIIVPDGNAEEPLTAEYPTIEATPKAETTTRNNKKQRRKSMIATTSSEEPANVKPTGPVEERVAMPEANILSRVTSNSRQRETEDSILPAENTTATPSASELNVEEVSNKLKGVHSRSISDISTAGVQVRATEPDHTPQQPLLHKKSSKKHKLAALFERGASQDSPSAERNLRREGSGSVRNLAERYESQSRSVTPVLPPSPEKRYLSRPVTPVLPPSPEKRHVARVASRSQLGLASPVRSDSKSPAREIDFAATVAASLQESGFDPGYVINDKSFHRSNSISGARDITPDDDITAAKERASRSRLGSLSRSSSVSGSPKLRPTQPTGPDVLPPIEVAMAPTDTVSFDPLDVLNDPAFAARKSPPGVLEEADPDELAGSSSLRRTKGKKRRHPLPEIPVVVDKMSTQDTGVAQTKQGKKSKKDKEQAPRQQDGVEYAAAETPAIEALSNVPLAVETPVDSTVREVEPARSMPHASTNTAVLPDVPTQATNVSATPTEFDDVHSSRRDKRAESKKTVTEEQPAGKEDSLILPVTFDQEPRSLTAEEPREYPFPQVVSQEILKQSKEETHKQELEKERDMNAWAPSPKKKGKKSRNVEEKVDEESTARMKDALPAEARTADREVHKRRTHPVSFDDERPEEKRLHTLKSTQEPQFTSERSASPSRFVVPELAHLEKHSNERVFSTGNAQSSTRGVGPADEPSWSFAGVQDKVDQATTKAQPEQPIETAPRKLRRSKEPKTPLSAPKRSIATDHDADSPALPTHPMTLGTPTTSDEYATKERSSHLFDSSPSTRAYGTSPAAPQTPAHDTHMVVETPSKDVSGSSRAGKKPRVESHQGRASPTKELTQKEPYQSLFGDPNEKKSETLSSTIAKPERTSTPGTKQLESITEVSPDDTTTKKKSRSAADVGVSDRGLKSARRTESLRQLSDRLRSPPPSTPTPTGRRSVQSTVENVGGRDSPWQQVNEGIDRTMALSPARRMPRSSPSADPLKQRIGEQRSPSVQSQRSLSNIARLRSPDQERPMSSLSNHSERSLRRVDRQTSGDLRSASRLGAASAQDAKSVQPNLSSTALAAGAAAIAGIAAPPVYDPVRGTGRGRRTSMAETFVSSLMLL